MLFSLYFGNLDVYLQHLGIQMKNKKIILSFAVVALLCIVIAAVFIVRARMRTDGGAADTHSGVYEKSVNYDFTLAVMPTTDCLPLFVARDRHYFDSLGVKVNLKEFYSQLDCDTAFLGRSVDGGVTDLLRLDNLNSRGTSLRPLISTNAYWQLIASRRSRISHLQQLGDKIIAASPGSAALQLVNNGIDAAKPKNEVYRVTFNDERIRLKMLINNEIDAVLLTEPQATEGRLAGNPVLYDTRDSKLNAGVIAFDANVVKKRKEKYDAFVKAYNMACDEINRNGAAHYTEIIKKYCSVNDRTVKMLPKQTFRHAEAPGARELGVFVKSYKAAEK